MEERVNILLYIVWGCVFALVWSICGFFTIPIFFAKADGSFLALNVKEFPFIIQVVKNWAIGGFLIGVISSSVLYSMMQDNGRKPSFSTYQGLDTIDKKLYKDGVNSFAAIAGALICTWLYNKIDLPQEMYLKSYYWRIPIGAILAIIGTKVCHFLLYKTKLFGISTPQQPQPQQQPRPLAKKKEFDRKEIEERLLEAKHKEQQGDFQGATFLYLSVTLSVGPLPEYHNVYSRLALVAYKAGDLKAAQHALETWSKLDINEPELGRTMQQLYRKVMKELYDIDVDFRH